ncbi:MAG: DegT/DnrJ/EryC1/StrS family aminotransferase [Candidatus Methanomethylicia archaeon]
MPIPRHYLSLSQKEIIKAIKSIFNHRIYDNKIIGEFEEKFSDYIGTKYAIATSSARMALYLILKVLDIGKGSEVILPVYTDIVVPSVIAHTGAKPVFVDIEEDTYNIDPDKVEDVISKKTKAIIPVHLYGNPCDMDRIMKIASANNLYVIEDCAHALGAKYKDKKVGSIGNAGYFSFSLGKHITTGSGGIITTNDIELILKIKNELRRYPYPNTFNILKNLSFLSLIKILTSHAIFDSFTYLIILTLNEFNYPLTEKIFKHDERVSQVLKGYKNKFTIAQALLGIQQLKKIDELNNKRRNNAILLTKLLEKFKEIKLPKERNGVKHVFLRYTIRIKERDRVRKLLLRRGIDTGIDYDYLCNEFFNDRKNYPIANRISKEVLNLPIHPNIKQEEILQIYHSLRFVLGNLS